MCDEYFQNEEMLGGALDSYGSCVVMAATNMYFIQEYLDRALKLCPEISDQIYQLKEAYGRENEALQKVAEKQGGLFFDADRNALLNKEFRVELSQLVRRVGECYAEAAKVAPISNE